MESFKLVEVGTQPDGRVVYVAETPDGDVVVSIPLAFGRDSEIGLTRTPLLITDGNPHPA